MLYDALLKKARFFNINKLKKWLSEQKYLKIVKIAYSITEINNLNTLTMTINNSVEIAYNLIKKEIQFNIILKKIRA